MPAFFSDRGSDVLLNCGLRAERGTVRTSTTRVTPCARSSSMNSSIGCVEWPTVRTGIASPASSCRDSDFLGLVQQGEVVERGAPVGGVVVLEEVPVLLEEQGDPGLEVGFEQDAGRGAHAADERLGDLDLADLAALAFDVDSTSGIERGERGEELALEPFLRRLRAVGEIAQDRAAMRGELLQVECLFARAMQVLEVAALAASRRTVDHDEAEG